MKVFLGIVLQMIFLFHVSFCGEIRLEITANPSDPPIFIIGDFTSWNKTPMLYDSSKSLYYLILDLKPGIYEYRFVQGDKVFRDPNNLLYGGSHSNSLLVVPDHEPQIVNIFPKNGSVLHSNDSMITIRYLSNQPIDLQESVFRIQEVNVYPKVVDENMLGIPIAHLSNGLYTFYFQIADIHGKKSLPARGAYKIKKNNHPPRAEAGYAYISYVGEKIKLCGLHSSDPDYDPIQHFRWSLKEHSGTIQFLTSDTLAEPELIALEEGIYSFQLSVSDGEFWSEPDSGIIIVVKSPKTRVTFRIEEDSLKNVQIEKVQLVGEFNRWNSSTNPMKKSQNYWATEILLSPGIYEYKFVINDSLWIADPGNPERIKDGWNGYNSLIRVEPPEGYQDISFLIRDSLISFCPKDMKNGKPANIAIIPDPNNTGKIKVEFDHNGNLLVSGDGKVSEDYFYIYFGFENDHFFSRVYSFVLKEGNGSCKIYREDSPPNWVKQNTLYQIFTPAFGPVYNHFNLHSIRENLDYFGKLHIHSLWLTPIYPAPIDHRYTPTDFFRVDSLLGGEHAFRKLLNDMHQRNMKLFFDFVANHSGDQHPFFISAFLSPNSFFREFYRFHDEREYEFHNDWDQLPNLNYNSTVVRQYMKEVALHWVNEGVDAFRCDAAWGVPHSFWKFLRKEIKRINPEFVLLNEVLPRDPAYHEYEFDLSYNTDLYGNILDFLRGKKNHQAIALNYLKDYLNFPHEAGFMNYLENHDMPRFIKEFGEENARFFSALIILTSGLPMIYHGQETGLTEIRKQFFPATDTLRSNRYFEYFTELLSLREQMLQYGLFSLISGFRDELMIFKNSRYLLIFNLTNNVIEYKSDLKPVPIRFPMNTAILLKKQSLTSQKVYRIPPASFLILENK